MNETDEKGNYYWTNPNDEPVGFDSIIWLSYHWKKIVLVYSILIIAILFFVFRKG